MTMEAIIQSFSYSFISIPSPTSNSINLDYEITPKGAITFNAD
jgi:hypothetical protein